MRASSLAAVASGVAWRGEENPSIFICRSKAEAERGVTLDDGGGGGSKPQSFRPLCLLSLTSAWRRSLSSSRRRRETDRGQKGRTGGASSGHGEAITSFAERRKKGQNEIAEAITLSFGGWGRAWHGNSVGRVINLSSFTTLSAFTEEKRGGLDRWELLSHWRMKAPVARVGDTGSRRLKQTFSPTRPKGHPIHRQRGHAAMCPSFAMRPRERRRSGHREGREGGEERYKLFESRVEAERPGEGERIRGGPQWRRRRISSLSTEREKERLGRSSEVNERACRRAMQLWNTKEPRDEATRGQHATFPMHQRVRPLLQIRLPHLIPKTKSESAEGGIDPSSSGLLCLLHLQPAFPTFPLPVPVSPGIRPFQMMRYLWGNHFPVVTPFISASLPLARPPT